MQRVPIKIILVGVAGFAFLLMLLVYLPIALYRDFRRSDDEELASWMGDARGRKRRLVVILTVFLGVALILAVLAPNSP
jgi:hypothetical protein